VKLLAAVALAAISLPAQAQTTRAVIAAQQAGVVGERFDGYLGLAAPAPERVQREVGAINIKRRSLYTQLAARRRVTVSEVGIAAGCELLAAVGVGEANLLNDGKWRRRSAGQPAPVPGYCTH
jgi:uncharacterized protein YdbL (DUF1318 family)